MSRSGFWIIALVLVVSGSAWAAEQPASQTTIIGRALFDDRIQRITVPFRGAVPTIHDFHLSPVHHYFELPHSQLQNHAVQHRLLTGLLQRLTLAEGKTSNVRLSFRLARPGKPVVVVDPRARLIYIWPFGSPAIIGPTSDTRSSALPSSVPVKASVRPSVLPSSVPVKASVRPSVLPSSVPVKASARPSVLPSSVRVKASARPSVLPSSVPVKASARPSVLPSSVPVKASARPSVLPSSVPVKASVRPSVLPSSVPVKASARPSVLPSSVPVKASVRPSVLPSTVVRVVYLDAARQELVVPYLVGGSVPEVVWVRRQRLWDIYDILGARLPASGETFQGSVNEPDLLWLLGPGAKAGTVRLYLKMQNPAVGVKPVTGPVGELRFKVVELAQPSSPEPSEGRDTEWVGPVLVPGQTSDRQSPWPSVSPTPEPTATTPVPERSGPLN